MSSSSQTSSNSVQESSSSSQPSSSSEKQSSSSTQSRRFECVLENELVLRTTCSLLKTNVAISFLKWSKLAIYIEVRVKKSLGFFRGYPTMELVRTVGACSFKESEVIGTYGTPMETRQIPKAVKAMSTPEKLTAVFRQIRDEKEEPDLSEDVTAIIHRSEFDAVITTAKWKNLCDSYQLELRPWQRKALSCINNQNNRELLWIFDFTGNSGKTEMGNYLRYKLNFHQLAPGKALNPDLKVLLITPILFLIFNNYNYVSGSADNVCGQVKDSAAGYFIDFTRSRKKLQLSYDLMEAVKSGKMHSGKYHGCDKILKNTKMVVFSNFLPNMLSLSLDRWSFFHTKLGIVYLECRDVAPNQYVCCLSRINKACTSKEDKLYSVVQHDRQFFDEYLALHNFDLNFRLLHENSLAFPSVKDEHRADIRRMLKKKNFNGVIRYVKEKKLLKNSILPDNYKLKLQIRCNDDTSESSSDSDTSDISDTLDVTVTSQ